MNHSLVAPLALPALQSGTPAGPVGARLLERLGSLLGFGGPVTGERRIPGLPEALSGSSPSDPAIVLARDARAITHVLASLARDCNPARRIVWLGFSRGPQHRLVPPPPLGGRVMAFAWSADAATQVQRLGADRVLGELRRCGMRPGDTLVIDAFEPWLGGPLAPACPREALEEAVGTARAALLEWSRDHRGALLVLGRAQVDGRALAPVLAGAGFTRVATVRGGSEVRLSAARWGEELGSPRSWCAMPGHPGAWSESGGVCASADGETGESVEPEDPLAVHALGDALPEGSEAPEHWILHSGMDDLITSCEHAGEGSVALSCGGSGDFPELARAVHRLRRAHPADFPIVVRESAVRLRNSERRILRMLGVSGIAAREEGFPRVLDLLAGGRGEARAHSIDGTGLERLLRAVAPGSETGYLPAPQFCEAVRSAVASAAGTPVGHVLAQLPLLRHVRHLDALLACFVRRSGDLVTADAEGLVVLLHGCDQRDAIPTLEQLFEIPVSELFGLIRLHWDEHSQRREVDALARAWEGAPTDYSTALELLHARPVSSAPRGAPPERGSTLVRVPASLLPTRILSLRAGPQGPAPSNP